jgi:NADPH:quinone reductase
MRAMVTQKFWGPELFEERDDVERPSHGPGQVLVRVLAASTDPIDTKLRADGSFAGLEPPVILGADVSGVIEEVGPGVEDLAPGDEVTTHRRSSVPALTGPTPSITSPPRI